MACARKLVAKGVIQPTDSVLCVLSGNGMRDLKLMEQGQKEVPFVKYRDVEAVKAAVNDYLNDSKD